MLAVDHLHRRVPQHPQQQFPLRLLNRPPSITGLSGGPAFGIADLTTFAFSVFASDPDGDQLTYAWSVVDSGRGQVRNGSGPNFQGTFSQGLLGSVVRFVVSDGRGGTASRDSQSFVVGSMSWDWMVTSPRFPDVAMFYLRLRQDAGGVVVGDILTITETVIGKTDPGAPGRIDAQGQVTIRLKFNNGADVTIAGQMQTNGDQVIGRFVNARATFNGVPLDGLPATMEID